MWKQVTDNDLAWELRKEGMLVNHCGKKWEPYKEYVGAIGYEDFRAEQFIESAAEAYVRTEE